ncbi:MAG: SPASM domain-containing protein [Desulfuromonadales bacterium]|nr:SPASM domain-containing protein [Desulfuromonadales bacterium]
MTIAQLDTPLRATWELHDPAGEIAPQTELVSEKLVDAGLFYLTLVARPLAHPAIAGILTILRNGGIQVQATFASSEEEWQGLAALESLPDLAMDANALLVRGEDHEWEALRQTLERLRQVGAKPALWMVPDRERLPLLPRLCDFCRCHGVTRIKLPNTPVDASFSARQTSSLPTPVQLAALRSVVIDPVALRSGLTLEVHDLFLWEILFPGERENGRSEYGGCQAANSLAHITANCMVHPCSSWPYVLGSLLEQDFAAIWQQRERAVVLEKIAALPAGCDGCGDYDQCFGGCRGLVETLGDATDGRDLLCAGRRPVSQNGSY